MPHAATTEHRGPSTMEATSGGFVTTFGPELALLTVVVLWASTYIVAKDLYGTISPFAFIGVRFALMIPFSWAVLLIQSGRAGTMRTSVRVRRADLRYVLLAGAAGYTFYQLGFALGLARTSPFSSSLLIAMTPVFTVIILAFLGERTPPLAWIGLTIAVVGACVFLLDKREGQSGSIVGDLLSLGAAVSFASYGIVNRPLTSAYAPATATAYGVTAGGIPLVLVSLPAMLREDWGEVSLWQWLALIYLVIFPVYAAYMLWNWGISKRGVASASRFSLLVPVVSGVFSALLFAESFGLLKVLGAVAILAGLLIARTRPNRR